MRNQWTTRGQSQLSPGHSGLPSVPRGPRLQWLASPNKERNRALFMSGGVPDCPMRPPTEGKNCLPNGAPTAPSYLGAIKGTPRRMEELSKHSLSILSLPHSISVHVIDFLSDLSSVLVVNLLCFI